MRLVIPADQATVDITVDTTGPIITLDTVSGDDAINALESNSDVTLSGTTNGVEAGQTVTLKIDSAEVATTTVGSVNESGEGVFSTDVSLSSFNDGVHVLTADVSDAAGNPADQATVDITVDTTGPIITLDTVSGDDAINALESNSDVTLSGTTTGVEAGQTVTLKIDSAEVATTTVGSVNESGEGVFSTDVSLSSFNDGVHVLTADVSDAAGNPADQATVDITVDTTGPIITLDTVSGDDAINALESNSDVTLSGTTTGVEAGQTVTLKIDSAEVATTTVGSVNESGEGVFSTDVSLSSFNDGVHVLTADVSDAAGNPADQATVDITVDTTGPIITLDTVSGDDAINALESNSDVTLSGTTTGVEAGQTVTLKIDSAEVATTTVGSVNESGEGVFSTDVSLSSLVDGDHVLTADVSDAAGNPADQATVDITVDTTGPIITLDTVSGDDAINALESNSDVTLSGTTTGVEAGQTVTLKIDSAEVATTTVGSVNESGEGVFSTDVSLSSFNDGVHVLTADVSDAAGNPADQATVDITVDTTGPIITLDTVSGDDAINALESNSDVTLSGTTTGVEAGQTVTLKIDSAEVATTTVGSVNESGEGVFSTDVSLSSFNDGVHVLTADVSDAAGNPADQATVDITVDTTGPIITLDTVSGDDAINALESNSDVTLSGTTTGVEAGQTVTLKIDSAEVATTTVGSVNESGEGVFSTDVSLSSFNDGVHVLTADVSDAAGNPADQATVDITVDTTGPIITLDTVSGDDAINALESNSDVTLSGTTTGVEAGQTVTLKIDSAEVATTTVGSVNESGEGVFSTDVSLSSFNDGVHVLTADVSDAAGNPADQATVDITVDTTGPIITLDTVSGDDAINALESNSDVTLSGTTTGVEAGQTVTLKIDSAEVATTTVGSVNESGEGVFSTDVSLSSLVDGDHVLTADVSDAAGNPADQATVDITVDTTGPSIESISISSTTNTTGIYKVDDLVEVTITANNSDTGLVFSTKTFNGYALDNSVEGDDDGVTDNGGGTYTTTYTVEEGHDDVAAGGEVAIVLEYADAAGNAAADVYTANTNLPNDTSIDANSPTIDSSSISVAAGTYGIGGEIAITINASESGLSLHGFGDEDDGANGTFNGQKITDFANLGTSNTYTGKYTVIANDASVADEGEVDVNIALVDASGNIGTAVTKVMLNGTAIDAQAPAITSASIVDSGNYVVGDSIIIYVTSQASEGSAVQIKDGSTVGTNSYVLTDRQMLANSSDVYTAVYVVQEDDVVDTENNTNTLASSIILTDSAGNDSAAWTTVDVPDNFTIDASSPDQTIDDIAISDDTGATDNTGTNDFITKTASQEITATLSVALGGGDSLYGSVDSGANWTNVSNITDAVDEKAISWATELKEGTYNIVFQVRDSSGNEGEATTQQYTLDTGEPTIALAAAEITANEASTATLDASTSSDDDGGTGIVSYAWKQVESDGSDLGNSSTALSISDASSASTTATTPVLLNVDDSLDESTENVSFYFQLTIEDLAGNEASEILTLTVSNYTTPTITATAGTAPDFDQISLSWDADSSLTYSLYRSTQDNCFLGNYQACSSPALYTDGTGLSIADNSASVADSGLSFLTPYYYWLQTKRDSTVIALSPAPGSGSATTATTATTSGPQLNDTGVVAGGDYPSGFDTYNGSNTACNGGYLDSGNSDTFVAFTNEDCEVGRDEDNYDNTDGHAGFSFTRLNFSGSEYSGSGDYATQPWSCVIDNVTGLVWEIKTTNGGTSDNSNQYTWPDNTNPTTQELVEATNTAQLCGLTNWRLPTVQEIESLASYNYVPAIDADYFPNTKGDSTEWYWTTDPDSSGSNNLWAYNAHAGSTVSAGSGSTYYVRLVSSSDAVGAWFSDYSDSRYTDNEDGTISDHRTGLMWMKCSYDLSNTVCDTGTATSGDWQAAFDKAATANDNGGTFTYTDWRLPNKKELSSIVDLTSNNPAINQTIFPNTQSADYWTSTPSSTGSADEAFTIDFATGTYGAATRSTNTIYVRLVRDITATEY